MSKSNSRGTIRLESTQIRRWPGRRLYHCEVVAMDTQVRSGQMVLMVVRQGGWTTSMVAKDVRAESWKMILGSQGTYLKTDIVTA
jgi:hypothetical protein